MFFDQQINYLQQDTFNPNVLPIINNYLQPNNDPVVYPFEIDEVIAQFVFNVLSEQNTVIQNIKGQPGSIQHLHDIAELITIQCVEQALKYDLLPIPQNIKNFKESAHEVAGFSGYLGAIEAFVAQLNTPQGPSLEDMRDIEKLLRNSSHWFDYYSHWSSIIERENYQCLNALFKDIANYYKRERPSKGSLNYEIAMLALGSLPASKLEDEKLSIEIIKEFLLDFGWDPLIHWINHKQVRCFNFTFEELATIVPDLIHLDLSHMNLSEEQFQYLIDNSNGNLQRLILSDTDITGHCLKNIGKKENLTVIDLTNCCDFNASLDLSRLTKLEILNLSMCISFNQPLDFTNTKVLRILSLSECNSFNQSLQLNQLMHFKILRIRDCFVFNQPLILENLPEFQELEFVNCRNYNQPICLLSLPKLKTIEINGLHIYNQPFTAYNLTNIESISIQCCYAFNAPITISTCINVTSFILDACPAFNQPLPFLPYLPLKRFIINYSAFDHPLDLRQQNDLEFFQLSDCSKFNQEINLQFSPILKTLIIRDCNSFHRQILLSELGGELKKITLVHCPNFSYQINLHSFKNLENVEVYGCETDPTYILGSLISQDRNNIKIITEDPANAPYPHGIW